MFEPKKTSCYSFKIFHFSFESFLINILIFEQGSPTFTIDGIQHLDYKSHPVSVTLKGNIGDRSITLEIESQRSHGINSTFIFFTN